MVSPFKDIDKQALLETENSFDFYDKLLSILELETIVNFQITLLINTHCKITNFIFNFFIFVCNLWINDLPNFKNGFCI